MGQVGPTGAKGTDLQGNQREKDWSIEASRQKNYRAAPNRTSENASFNHGTIGRIIMDHCAQQKTDTLTWKRKTKKLR